MKIWSSLITALAIASCSASQPTDPLASEPTILPDERIILSTGGETGSLEFEIGPLGSGSFKKEDRLGAPSTQNPSFSNERLLYERVRLLLAPLRAIGERKEGIPCDESSHDSPTTMIMWASDIGRTVTFRHYWGCYSAKNSAVLERIKAATRLVEAKTKSLKTPKN